MASNFLKKTIPFPSESNVDEATEVELYMHLIQQYSDLQRIKNAADKEKELDFQINVVKQKLAIFGFEAEKLDFC